MASLCRRVLITAVSGKRQICSSAIRCTTKVTFGDPLEHATGLEKRELLAKLAGNKDPFYMEGVKKGPGTKAQPTEIPSAYEERIVGCNCEEEASHLTFFWLLKDQPKRCECGHWYKLIYKKPV